MKTGLSILPGLLVATSFVMGGAARAEGNGIKFGEGRLHPSFGLEGGYDSLVGFGGLGNTAPTDVVGDIILHFQPALRFELPSDDVAFDAHLGADYNLYAGIPALSYLGLTGDLTLDINRRGKFAVQIGDRVVRSDQTNALSLGAGVLSTYNDAHIRGVYRPGGGALEFGVGYDLALELFSARTAGSQFISACPDVNSPLCNPALVGEANYLNHSISVDGRWKFLPKTALLLESSIAARTYNDTSGFDVPAYPLRALLGLAGLITTRTTLVFKAGYGDALINGPSFRSAIGELEVGYDFSDTAVMHIGAVRTFEPVPSNLAFYEDDRAYFDAHAQFFGKLLASTYVGYDYLVYANNVRTDSNLTATVGLDYEIGFWLRVGAGYTYTLRQSTAPGIGFNYDRSEVFLHTVVSY